MARERVNVLLSYFNGGRFVDAQIASVLAQDSTNMKIFVRNDGSTDNSFQVFDKFRDDARFVIRQGPNMGPARSFFELLRVSEANADYYAFCDQDDVWMPDKMSRAVAMLSRVDGTKPALYCSRVQYVDLNLRTLGYSATPVHIGFGNALIQNIAIGCTTVLNRCARNLILDHAPAIHPMHDRWCYLVVSCFGRVLFDEYASIRYRLHDSNVVGAETTLVGQLIRRLSRQIRPAGSTLRASEQAKIFLDTSADTVEGPNLQLLNQFVAGKHSLRTRLRLVTSRTLRRQRILDDVLFRALVLVNRY